MSFSLGTIREELAGLEDQVTDNFADVRDDVSDGLDDLASTIDESNVAEDLSDDLDDITDDVQGVADDVNASDIFDGSVFEDVWERSGFANLGLSADIGNLNDIADRAEDLPFGLGDPDATGEVPTGSAALPREIVAVAVNLSASARIIETLGQENVATVAVRGEEYQFLRYYADPVSGFYAVRLQPLDGGTEVFAIDGLEVGSRPDEVAAATLGRLQVESEAFRIMIEEASTIGLTQGRQVMFTGPSLGGAVAQVAAYEVAEDYAQAGAPFGPGAVHLVTVDPLGGRDAAEAINGGSLDAAALNLIGAVNVRTEGDIVSRIGSHIGATKTLPALDAAGNPVTLDAAEAHVNAVSLLQSVNSDAIWNAAPLGAPAEIGGFAAASNAAADAVIDAWFASQASDPSPPGELQIPGTASFDATGTVWSLDADDNGSVDISVTLRSPVDPATADLVLA